MAEISFDEFARVAPGGKAPPTQAGVRIAMGGGGRVDPGTQAERDAARLTLVEGEKASTPEETPALEREAAALRARGITPAKLTGGAAAPKAAPSEMTFEDFAGKAPASPLAAAAGGAASSASKVSVEGAQEGALGGVGAGASIPGAEQLLSVFAPVGEAFKKASWELHDALENLRKPVDSLGQRTSTGKVFTPPSNAATGQPFPSGDPMVETLRKEAAGKQGAEPSFWERPAGRSLLAIGAVPNAIFEPAVQEAKTFVTDPVTKMAGAAQSAVNPKGNEVDYSGASRPMAEVLTFLPTGGPKRVGVEALQDIDRSLTGTGGGGKLPAAGLENRSGYPIEPPKGYTPPEPYVPQAVQAAGPELTAKQQIEATMGIKSLKDREAYTKQRMAEVRGAFKDDPEYANYLGALADERASNTAAYAAEEAKRLAAPRAVLPATETVKTRMTEGTVLGEEAPKGSSLPIPPSLDTAIAKVSAGRSFDLTAEERIALQGMQREPNRIVVPVWTGAPRLDAELAAGASRDIPFKDLPDYARESIEHKAFYDPRNLSDAELAKSPWERATVEVDALKGKNPVAEDGSTSMTKGPIVLNADGAIVDGNHRFADAVRAGAKEIEVYRPMLGRGIAKGEIDPRLLARIAATGVGGVTGAKLDPDNPLRGAFMGALIGNAGLSALAIRPSAVWNGIKKVWEADKRISVKGLIDAHETGIAQSSRFIWQFQRHIEDLVPMVERRAAVTAAIEKGDLSGLSEKERIAAGMGKEFFASAAKQGLESGVLKNALENYVTHIWGKDEKTKGILEEMFQGKKAASMSPETRFALERSIPTLEAGKKLGMTPETEDLSTIIGHYGNSVFRAMENKKIIDALKGEKVGDETVSVMKGRGENRKATDIPQTLVMPSAQAPSHFVYVGHPALNGMRVHPDIKPALSFIFSNSDPGAILNGMSALNTAIKRNAVSFSLFHAKALGDALVGAMNNPVMAVKLFAQSSLPKIFGETEMTKMLREGGAGDLVDKALEGGLKFTLEKGPNAVEDVSQSFYQGMKGLQKFADSIIPGAGMAVKGYAAVNHMVDKFMWERLHAGLKLNVFAEKYEKLLQNNAAAHSRNPRMPLLADKDIAEMAAAYTNDIFGGLNWRRMSEEYTTKWGRDLAMAAFNPQGRQYMQLLMFAPDWTISTTRAMKKALTVGGGSGVRGLVEPLNVTDLHRQQLLRSAIYYGAVGDTLNYALSGKHIWENKDPTVIDMGDGRTMQWSKHTMEPIHWLTKPIQQGINKLGFFPKEIANQTLGTEYLAPRTDAQGNVSAGPAMQENRAMHVLKSMTPISVQQGMNGADATSGIAGFLGAPIYGKTHQQRADEREARAAKRRAQR